MKRYEVKLTEKDKQEEAVKLEERSSFVTSSDIASLVIPWGWADMEEAANVASNFNIPRDDIEDSFEDFGGMKRADKIDIVALVYDIALNYLSNEFEKITGEDIREYVRVSGNYLATSWDGTSSQAYKQFEAIVQSIGVRNILKQLSRDVRTIFDDIVSQFGIK